MSVDSWQSRRERLKGSLGMPELTISHDIEFALGSGNCNIYDVRRIPGPATRTILVLVRCAKQEDYRFGFPALEGMHGTDPLMSRVPRAQFRQTADQVFVADSESRIWSWTMRNGLMTKMSGSSRPRSASDSRSRKTVLPSSALHLLPAVLAT